jgi:hypothetical protein
MQIGFVSTVAKGSKTATTCCTSSAKLSLEGFSRREDIPSNKSESSSYKLTAENQ